MTTTTAAIFMASKYNSTCTACDTRIAAGEPIAYNPEMRAQHAECYAIAQASALYVDSAACGVDALRESIAVTKADSNIAKYEISEDWYIARMFRYCVPSIPSEDAAWDAADADRADDMLATMPVQEVRTQLVELAPAPAVEPVTLNLAQGTYTIVFNDDSITIRISKEDNGTQWINILTGPNNESDYRPIATLNHGALELTYNGRKMATTTLARRALAWLTAATDEQRREAGRAFAVASSRCYRCGRTLTVVSSIDAGLGPICAGREYGD